MSDEGHAPTDRHSARQPNENRDEVIHLREERSDIVFFEVTPDDGETNRREGFIGFAPRAAERRLAITPIALSAFAETKNAAR